MKIVLAPDSFKGSLSASDFCRIAGDVIRSCRPDVDVVSVPMADGGEGTAEAIRRAVGGEWVPLRVSGPLPDQHVEAGYLQLPGGGAEALVEMAMAAGLTLVPDERRNPLLTSTMGVGEIIRSACDAGHRRIWLAVGGSATVDGGAGAAVVLGWRLLDGEGYDLEPGGGALARLERVVPPDRPLSAEVLVLCDVDNLLCGPEGAAAVYGPQKGATPEMVLALDAGLSRLAERIRETTGRNIADVPGGGAAGGMAAGAMGFFGATLVPGIETVMDLCRLDEALDGASAVITGEGSLDGQSLRGKVVAGVARRAGARGVPVVVVAGRSRLTAEEAKAAGVSAVHELLLPGQSVEDSIANAPRRLAEVIGEWMKPRMV